jgi:predicted glycosyltransferase
MEKRGHVLKVLAVEKDISLKLLKEYKIDHTVIGANGVGFLEMGINMIKMEWRTYKIAKQFKPDLFVGRGSPILAHISSLYGKPYVSFSDTEHAKLINYLSVPFMDTVLTPSSFTLDFGKKHIRYEGYKELAYLHPNRFTPNPAVLTELGLAEDDPFIIVRFVSWQASHDVGQHGIRDKVGLVKALEQYGRVLITSEGALPPELQPYQIRVSPEKLHDLLYYATLYVGEGGTTASEAAVLGTPSIYVSSLVGTMGNFIELEETYDLLYSFTDGGAALDKAVEILQDPESKEKWRAKRDRLLADKIDVTAFMIWFVENYPESFTEMREHLEVQSKF